jgi:tRNA(adenine34) deaminase
MRRFMEKAIAQARLAGAKGEVPVGAVVVLDARIIAEAGNCTRCGNDPSAHAEMVAIRQACQALGRERLTGCDIYVTLEPCAMCAAAISFARLRRLYFGAPDPKGGAVEHGVRFFASSTCHHAPEVYSGLSASESSRLLIEFFSEKR